MTRKLASLSTLLALWLVVTGMARADAMRLDFSGALTSSVHSSWPQGSPFSGTLVLDPSRVGVTTEANGDRDYRFGGASQLTIQFQGRDLYSSQQPIDLKVPASPLQSSLGITQDDYFGMMTASLQLPLLQDAGTLFPASGPTPTLDPRDFGPSGLFVLSQNTLGPSGSYPVMIGYIDSIVAVPEPSSAMLVCLLGAGWLVRRRRGSRQP